MKVLHKNISHLKTKKNLLKFMKAFAASAETKKNLMWFFRQLVDRDTSEKTEFELSFKVKDDVLHKGEIRLLNIDARGYSYQDELSFLERLLFYKKMMWGKTTCERKKQIFSALETVAKTPLDLYGGADIFGKKFSFAFWLILGGVEQSGKISFVRNADKILKNIFDALEIRPTYAVSAGDILNLGFDLEEKSAFYKIYYILNGETEKFINEREKKVTLELGRLLGKSIKHWFFVSERYIIDETTKKGPGRRKIYLEFLDLVPTAEEKTFTLMAKIFKLVGCPIQLSLLRNYLGAVDGRIVIIAFEEDGTVTFYIRI